MNFKLRAAILAFASLPLSALRADEILFRDGTGIKDCLVRDEGRVMRVWKRRDDFPGRSRTWPRDEVKSFTIRRGEAWHAHEKLQDLSVTHLELSPPLVGLHGVYAYDRTGAPRLKARTSSACPGRVKPPLALKAIPDLGDANRLRPEEVVKGLKFTYEKGEKLTLTAYVKNTGFARAAPFEYVLELNGKEMAHGKCDRALGELETVSFSFEIAWPGADPVARFKVRPGAEEIASFNDERRDVLSGFAFDFLVSRRRIEYWHRYRNTLGSFSWEDYYQWHLDIMNRLFAESVYPTAPQGIKARVRLNRIFYLEEVDDRSIAEKLIGPDGLIRNQGSWCFRDSEAEKAGKWWRPGGNFSGCVTEWSLPHELGHQLGLIDYYNLDYHGREAFPVASSSEPVRFSHFFRHPRVMMHWHGPHLFHELTAESLNRTKGKPRGAYGDYIFQTPLKSYIQVLDVNGRPVPGASVEIYQRGAKPVPGEGHREPDGVRWWDVIEDGRFESRFYPEQPVIKGKTDWRGFMRLPNRPVKPARTLNGYERRPNPFGNINVVGQRGLMLALVTKRGRTNPFFLELADFNLACVRGMKEKFVLTLKGDFADAASPPPPACARLEYLKDGRWRLHWRKPSEGKDTTNRKVHRYRIYRRTGNEGLNFDPWDPVVVVGTDVFSFDLPSFPENPAQSVGAKRFCYGITSVNERGVESSVVELLRPDMRRVTGLMRRRPYGAFCLTLEGEVNLVRLGVQGRYYDITPGGTAMERPGEVFAVDGRGRMASTAWDRHGVNLYDEKLTPLGGLGDPYRPGSGEGEFRFPRGCALDGAGNLAVADGDNRRLQIFRARAVWGGGGGDRKHLKPACIIKGAAGAPFDCRVVGTALSGDRCLVLDERGRLYGFKIDLEKGRSEPLCRIEVGRAVSFRIESEDTFLVLHHDHGWLRRYSFEGEVRGETRELAGEKLKRPRGLVLLRDGRVATFQDLNGLLIGRFPRKSEAAPAHLPELKGVYRNPVRYEVPVLRPKILVLNYEPMVPDGKGGEVPLVKLMKWNDPHKLTDAYARDLYLMSGGYVACEIVEWKDIDGWPVKIDGFLYDDDSYLEALRTRNYHQPDGMDYAKLVEVHDLAGRVARGEIDEVWVWGGPGFGYYESRMVGPGAYWCNSVGLENERARRNFVIMGFNYERGLAEMIHDLGHRTESLMSHVYERDFGPWDARELRNDWERFSCVDWYVSGWSAVGNCHFPCNGEAHYDYANPRWVESSAEDWFNYPHLTGKRTLVNRTAWEDESGNRHLGYQRWFFSHLPRAPGYNGEGRLCNWWNYLFAMDSYAETRR